MPRPARAATRRAIASRLWECRTALGCAARIFPPLTLEPGSRVGPYQVVAPLGAGGMGEVHRARDTRLGRDVALKTLPSSFAADPERRARFEQEARAASALNHPNIITVHDVGEHDGALWIAMEHVEGRTLRELLASGPLPTRKTIEIAVQTAEGLAKAHGAGILHRDLKPDNLVVSKDGFVKILDFGLAKLVLPEREGLSELPTVARPATHAGAVMGTVGYMSPEQASGQSVDFRSDQFSLGTILYEMATGARPFQRKTSAETLAAIIREDPEDIATRNPRVPAPMRWLIERCLAKDPEDRFASTRDLARDLASLRDHLSETAVSGPTAAAPTRVRWRTAVGFLAVLLAGAGLGAIAARRGPSIEDIEFRPITFRRGEVMTARFAPDGQSVVYGAAWEGGPLEVHSVRLDSPESRPLGLPPADVLGVSSTGEMALSLGRRFVFGWESLGTLARMPLGGGAPREVLEDVQDADWTPDGSGLAVVRDAGASRRLEFPIGKVLYETAGWLRHPRFSRDGRTIALFDHARRGDNAGALMVVGLDGAQRTLAQVAASNGLAWSAAGDEIYTANGLAVGLNGRQRRILRVPGGLYVHDVAPDGRLLVSRTDWRREIVGRAPGASREQNLSWMDWSWPRDLSDDGRRVLFEEQNRGEGGNYLIYMRDTDGSPAVRLGAGHALALSPDGKWALSFVEHGDGGGAGDLVLLPTGAGESKTLPGSAILYDFAAFFPDGGRVLAAGREPGRINRLYVIDLADGRPRPISPEGVSWISARAVSPDGRLIVARAADGSLSLYPIDGGDGRAVPGAAPGDLPIRWTPDGRGLFVHGSTALPARVEIIDVATGKRSLFRELAPPEPAGVLAVSPVYLSADASAYVYSYRRVLDTLWVVEGVR